jgi:hypothetical protein
VIVDPSDRFGVGMQAAEPVSIAITGF